MCVQNRLFHEIIHLLYEDKHSFRNFVLVKLTDLKDLRVIKKNLEPQPEPKPQQNQPRKRSVELRSKEEEHARNEGFFKGQKVRMMDTNDTATLVGFGKDFYELELDGLTIRAVLDFQMNYFRKVLRKNLKHRGRRLIFIHGVGDGTLAAALRKELVVEVLRFRLRSSLILA